MGERRFTTLTRQLLGNNNFCFHLRCSENHDEIKSKNQTRFSKISIIIPCHAKRTKANQWMYLLVGKFLKESNLVKPGGNRYYY